MINANWRKNVQLYVFKLLQPNSPNVFFRMSKIEFLAIIM